jgi:hypothetical protein
MSLLGRYLVAPSTEKGNRGKELKLDLTLQEGTKNLKIAEDPPAISHCSQQVAPAVKNI